MKKILLTAVISAGLTGCFGGSDFGTSGMPTQGGNPGPGEQIGTPATNPDGTPIDPVTGQPVTPVDNGCAKGASYTGFGGTQLEVGRIENELGVDRARVKPFTSLQTEFPRVLQNTPALLAQSASTFDSAAARWFVEPQANAVSLYTNYRIAFQGCLTAVDAPAKYDAAPTADTAQTECRDWARKFWSRTPTDTEISACVKVATQDTTTETVASRRWAYTCAAVLTAAGFTTY